MTKYDAFFLGLGCGVIIGVIVLTLALGIG
jgi:hypothetical protein